MIQGASPIELRYVENEMLRFIAALDYRFGAPNAARASGRSDYFTTTSRGRAEKRSQPVSVTRIVSLKPTP